MLGELSVLLREKRSLCYTNLNFLKGNEVSFLTFQEHGVVEECKHNLRFCDLF